MAVIIWSLHLKGSPIGWSSNHPHCSALWSRTWLGICSWACHCCCCCCCFRSCSFQLRFARRVTALPAFSLLFWLRRLSFLSIPRSLICIMPIMTPCFLGLVLESGSLVSGQGKSKLKFPCSLALVSFEVPARDLEYSWGSYRWARLVDFSWLFAEEDPSGWGHWRFQRDHCW